MQTFSSRIMIQFLLCFFSFFFFTCWGKKSLLSETLRCIVFLFPCSNYSISASGRQTEVRLFQARLWKDDTKRYVCDVLIYQCLPSGLCFIQEPVDRWQPHSKRSPWFTCGRWKCLVATSTGRCMAIMLRPASGPPIPRSRFVGGFFWPLWPLCWSLWGPCLLGLVS